MDKKLDEDITKICQYLEVFPFYKWAAKSIGRSEDWLADRRKEYPEIADRCEVARSAGMAKYGKRASPDFLLACADPETFAKAKKIDVTVLPTPILDNLTKDVQNNNSNTQDSKPE